ncbi:hypothetical protein C0989_000604 [Termitomyces sp. Mn162]|nr:hypothetical protein C0989_000604 [Termitomyces sp. Mn162]
MAYTPKLNLSILTENSATTTASFMPQLVEIGIIPHSDDIWTNFGVYETGRHILAALYIIVITKLSDGVQSLRYVALVDAEKLGVVTISKSTSNTVSHISYPTVDAPRTVA